MTRNYRLNHQCIWWINDRTYSSRQCLLMDPMGPNVIRKNICAWYLRLGWTNGWITNQWISWMSDFYLLMETMLTNGSYGTLCHWQSIGKKHHRLMPLLLYQHWVQRNHWMNPLITNQWIQLITNQWIQLMDWSLSRTHLPMYVMLTNGFNGNKFYRQTSCENICANASLLAYNAEES
jgi:hypothetical protein